MAGLSLNEAAEFQNVLRWLKRCLDVRFPCPSTSLDMKGRQPTNARLASHFNQASRTPLCSVLPLVQFFTFPHNIVHHIELFPSSCPQALKDEVERIVCEILTKSQQIIEVYNQRRLRLTEKAGIDVLTQVNLSDVFQVVKREAYPLLWGEMVKTLTVLPTTVSCEQCFSVVKHSIHVNMKAETFIANVTNKLHG